MRTKIKSLHVPSPPLGRCERQRDAMEGSPGFWILILVAICAILGNLLNLSESLLFTYKMGIIVVQTLDTAVVK